MVNVTPTFRKFAKPQSKQFIEHLQFRNRQKKLYNSGVASSQSKIRNSDMSGATVGALGSGGILPTNWSFAGAAVGTLILQIVAIGNELGQNYIDLRYAGTGTGDRIVQFEATNFIAALNGESWRHSLYFNLIAGSFANLSVFIESQNRNSANGNIGSNISLALVSSLRPLIYNKAIYDRTIANASTAFTTFGLRLTSSGSVDVTIRVATPEIIKLS